MISVYSRSQRFWWALRLIAALVVLSQAHKLKAEEAEIRRAVVVDDEPAAEPAPATQPPAPAAVQDEPGPVEKPGLQKYARLWKESLFTTRAMPAPESPKGPTFADTLTLSGTYEMNGKMAAVLIDSTTSSVMEVYIGEDNSADIRINKVEPGNSPDQMRIQLQKGTEVGWVSFAQTQSTPPPPAPPPAAPVSGSPVIPPPMPAAQPIQQPPAVSLPVMPAPTAPMPPPGYQLNQGMPQALPQVPNDVPLPPE
jgi:hypothetical protein